jgi:galactokinase
MGCGDNRYPLEYLVLVMEVSLTFRAPGRVNLIGEHTDYNLGFVLPIALDLACFITTSPSPDGQLHLTSENLEASRSFRLADISALPPSRDWTDYIIGVARELALAGFPVPALRLRIRSTVPVGSGLSSSAALEVASALALLQGRPIAPVELVRLCHRAETGFVGLPCGTMDQYVSVFGAENSALCIDCRTLTHELVSMPRGATILAVNTMVKHELGVSAYKQRTQECAAAVTALRQFYPRVESLRDVAVDEFEAVAHRLPAIPAKRARHIIYENARVLEFVEASLQGALEKMGKLFAASHRSLQYDYEVSCEELDFLVDTALSLDGV